MCSKWETKYILEFLRNHTDLVASQSWEDLFQSWWANDSEGSANWHDVLDILCSEELGYDLNRDILTNMTTIPCFFFAGIIAGELKNIDLNTVKIPSNIQSIQPNAFYCCAGIRHIIIDEGVKYIEGRAIEEVPTLKSITFPSTLEVGTLAHGSSIIRSPYPFNPTLLIKVPEKSRLNPSNPFGLTVDELVQGGDDNFKILSI